MSRVDRYIVRKAAGEAELASVLNTITDYRPVLMSAVRNNAAIVANQVVVYTVVFEKIYEPLDMG